MTRPIRPNLSRSPNLDISATRPRATGPSAGDRFRDSLGQAATTMLTVVEASTGIPTGSGALTAAIRQTQGSSATVTGSGSPGATEAGVAGGALGGVSGVAEQSNQAMELLEMQQAISAEQRQFQTVSNVMKARHDTAKAVIQNVR